MNENNTIAIINPSSPDGTGTAPNDIRQALKAYVSLANRINTRLTQNNDDFDFPSSSGVP